MNSWVQDERVKNNGRDSEVDTSRLKSYQSVKYTAAKDSYHTSVILAVGSRTLDADDVLISCLEA